MVAGAAALVLVAAAFVVAPTVWSQVRSGDNRDRRVLMLDGRGSAIGVSIRDLEAGDKATGGQTGVVVADVNEEGPAAKAGIREGDLIVELDGERVRSARHFARLVQETPEGRTVKAVIVRDGSRQTLDVTPEPGGGRYAGDFALPQISDEIERSLRALPRDFAFDLNWDAAVWPRGRLGAQLAPLTDQLAGYFGAKTGALVSSVDPDSVAAKAGLKAGDVITSVNGRTVDTPRDVTQGLRDVEGKDVEIQVLRDKKSLTLKAQMPERRRPSARRSRPA
jgi:serine protease Do